VRFRKEKEGKIQPSGGREGWKEAGQGNTWNLDLKRHSHREETIWERESILRGQLGEGEGKRRRKRGRRLKKFSPVIKRGGRGRREKTGREKNV